MSLMMTAEKGQVETTKYAFPQKLSDLKEGLNEINGQNVYFYESQDFFHIWLPAGSPALAGEIRNVEFNYQGTLPISGCASEWDSVKGEPTYRNITGTTGYVSLHSIQRKEGNIRIACSHNIVPPEKVQLVAGVVIGKN